MLTNLLASVAITLSTNTVATATGGGGVVTEHMEVVFMYDECEHHLSKDRVVKSWTNGAIALPPRPARVMPQRRQPR